MTPTGVLQITTYRSELMPETTAPHRVLTERRIESLRDGWEFMSNWGLDSSGALIGIVLRARSSTAANSSMSRRNRPHRDDITPTRSVTASNRSPGYGMAKIFWIVCETSAGLADSEQVVHP
ncbi:hypothetical protein [Streptomyces monashensis]|uniref:hypothetical protein n=1 Tax=Streptomyces monashensis TaxID=1678012 RepID=UPI0015A572B6|nr:hypothetical protein [Streptomyces monashensis]